MGDASLREIEELQAQLPVPLSDHADIRDPLKEFASWLDAFFE